jgi:hypothetical protein
MVRPTRFERVTFVPSEGNDIRYQSQINAFHQSRELGVAGPGSELSPKKKKENIERMPYVEEAAW